MSLASSSSLMVVSILLILLAVMYWWFQSRLEIREHQLARLHAEMNILGELWSLAGSGWVSPREALERALEVVAEQSGLLTASLFRAPNEGGPDPLELYATAWDKLPWAMNATALFLGDEGLVTQAVTTGRVCHTTSETEMVPILPGIRGARMLVAPVRQDQRLWGFLLVSRGPRRPGWTEADDVWFAHVAEQLRLLVALGEQAEFRRRAQTYQDLARYRSEFIANVSHDFRTPLGLIKGYASTLLHSREKMSEEEVAEFLGVVEEEANRLGEMIEQLLAMSRIESDRFLLQQQALDVEPILHNLAERVSKMMADAPEFTFRPDPSGPLRLWADPNWFPSVLDNLLANACKYGQGPVEVSMTHDGPMARIVIRDHGMGVHPQETHRIFERFYRSGPHRRSSVRGSGLGLSIAKRIVDAHHGRIWAENLPDGGFQVSVEVPLADDHRGRSSFPLSGRAEGDGDG